MLLRPATADDIPAIVALERRPVAREFVGQWSEERHRATLAGSDARYYVSETELGEVEAYAIEVTPWGLSPSGDSGKGVRWA